MAHLNCAGETLLCLDVSLLVFLARIYCNSVNGPCPDLYTIHLYFVVPNFVWLLDFDVQLLLFLVVQMALHWNRIGHGVENVLRGWGLLWTDLEGLKWRWLEAIDGTTNGWGNTCVLTQFCQWNGSWRFVLLFLRRFFGADVAAPSEKFHSPPPCIISKPWSNRCLIEYRIVTRNNSSEWLD